MTGKRTQQVDRIEVFKAIFCIIVIGLVIISSVYRIVDHMGEVPLKDRVEDLEGQVSQLQQENKALRNQLEALQEAQSYTLEETPTDEPHFLPATLYAPTEEELTILAQVIYNEARGIKDEAKQAAVVWCILNRLDAGRWGDTTKEVATAPLQFSWTPDTPVEVQFLHLAADVCERWAYEKTPDSHYGGRTLPSDYYYFRSNKDGTENLFTQEWLGTDYWDWSLPSPY